MPVSVMIEAGTIAELANRILEKNSRSPAMVVIQHEGCQPPLFCLHARDGDVMQYRNLKHYFGKDQPIYGIRFAAGSDGRQKEPLNVQDMAREYIRLIREIQPSGPYRLIGHSFGGMMAYEMANQLSLQGEKMELVALLDTGSPRVAMGRPTSRRIRNSWGKFKGISPLAWGTYFVAQIEKEWFRICRRLGIIREIRDVLQTAADNYIPSTYNGDVVLFRAAEETEWLVDGNDRSLGWDQYVRGQLHIVDVPGDHATHLLEPHVQFLAAKMKAFLPI